MITDPQQLQHIITQQEQTIGHLKDRLCLLLQLTNRFQKTLLQWKANNNSLSLSHLENIADSFEAMIKD